MPGPQDTTRKSDPWAKPPHRIDAWRQAITDGDDAHERGHAQEAERLYREALAMAWTCGERHPRVAVSLSRIGRVYAEMRMGDQARELSRQAIDTLHEPPGNLEPDELILTYEALGEASYVIGQLAQAADLEEQGLGEQERWLGPDHVDVAATVTRMALLYDRLKTYDRAAACLERAMSICEKNFGSDHPRLEEYRGNYRTLLRKMGWHDEAAAFAK